MISGSEVVKIDSACLLVTQVSGATHSTATDTPGEDREERREEEKRPKKIRTENEKITLI